jgi:general secretion pathway protein G
MKLDRIVQKRTASSHAGGFTLIEVLLVIVIIMMLAAALVVFVLPQQQGAEKNTTKLLLQQVQNCLDTYRLNIGHYPSENEGGLGALLVKPTYENERLGEKWQGPYLKPRTRLEDAWGHPLVYQLADTTATTGSQEASSGPPYSLYSAGPDGQPDTDDDIKLFDAKDASGQDANTVLQKN